MTRYEDLINKAEDCRCKAIATDNVDLKKFYLNAEQGYRKQAEELTVEEAQEVIK